MSASARKTALGLGLLLTLVDSGPGEAQVLAKTLLFNSVQPCRVADTRSAVAGILTAGTPRTFDVVGETTNYGNQGGVVGGCGIPGFAAGFARVQAVAINVVAVSPAGEGFLTAWPTGQPFPSASTVNFQKLVPNLNIANGVIVPVRQDVQGGDITIVAGVANTHVIVDITGFFSKAEPRKYYLTLNGNFNGAQALTACAAGYHMAALAEIFDTSNLSYNTALGAVGADSGSGPPVPLLGWTRTGNIIGSIADIPGVGNCNVWTSNVAGSHGSITTMAPAWSTASTVVSPWTADSSDCDTSFRVWCVEN